MRRRIPLALGLATVVVLAGCGGDEPDVLDPGATEAPTATTTVTETVTTTETVTATPTSPRPAPSPTDTAVALAQTCTSDQLGVTIGYPAGWHTTTGDVVARCRVFDPQPIDLEEGTEIPFSLAVHVDRLDASLDRAAEPGRGYEVLRTSRTTVAGHEAVVQHLRATAEAPLLPAGVEVYRYLVDAGDGTVLLATYSEGPLAFDEKQAILDRMAASLELHA